MFKAVALPVGLMFVQGGLYAQKHGLAWSQTFNPRWVISHLHAIVVSMGGLRVLEAWILGLGMLGLMPFILSVTWLKYRRPWTFLFSCLAALFLLYAGSWWSCLIGCLLLVNALFYRQQFFAQAQALQALSHDLNA